MPPVTPRTPFREAGNTDRASFKAALSRTIGGPSPVAREADAVYDALAPHKLTRIAAGMAWIERRNETDPGGLAYYPRHFHNLWAVKNPNGTWMQFGSYALAAAHWGPYVLGPTYAHLDTIAEFIGFYAPWSDGNNPDQYGRHLADEINALPLLDEGGSVANPVIYDLVNDTHAARFGLTPAERDRILAKNGGARTPDDIEGIGLHVQWGNTSGSLRHWLGVSASSTIMLQRDTSILKVIPELRIPWTQGDVKNPDAQATKLMNRYGWDPNEWNLTIEVEDLRSEDATDEQEPAIIWQIRQWQDKYPKLRQSDWADRILGHRHYNRVDRPRCGLYDDRIKGMMAAPGPVKPPPPVFAGLPAWLPEAALRAAFPLADPTGVVTKAIVAWAAQNERVPYFVEKIDLGGGSNMWRFEGVTLFNAGARVWREGEEAA